MSRASSYSARGHGQRPARRAARRLRPQQRRWPELRDGTAGVPKPAHRLRSAPVTVRTSTRTVLMTGGKMGLTSAGARFRRRAPGQKRTRCRRSFHEWVSTRTPSPTGCCQWDSERSSPSRCPPAFSDPALGLFSALYALHISAGESQTNAQVRRMAGATAYSS
jgi:hypothetical protein